MIHQKADTCDHGAELSRLVHDDAVDAAIEAGLMAYLPCPACNAAVSATLLEAQQHLLKAWGARDRHVARNARLARRIAEREQRRVGSMPHRQTSLPPAAADVLARAKAKAAERGKP